MRFIESTDLLTRLSLHFRPSSYLRWPERYAKLKIRRKIRRLLKRGLGRVSE